MNKTTIGIILVFFCTLLTASGQYFLKLGADSFTFETILTNYQLIVGFLLYGIGAVLLIFALKFGELSVIYPVISLTFVWVTLISIFVLGETLKQSQMGGIGMILVGVFLITRGVE